MGHTKHFSLPFLVCLGLLLILTSCSEDNGVTLPTLNELKVEVRPLPSPKGGNISALWEDEAFIYASETNTQRFYRYTKEKDLWLQTTLTGYKNAAIRCPDGRLVVGSHGTIMYSEDDGLSWKRAEVFGKFRGVNDFLIVDKLIFAALDGSGGGDDRILLSQNGGRSWESADLGIFPAVMYTLAYHQDTLYVGTNQQIYYSSDLGKQWRKFAENDPNQWTFTPTAIVFDENHNLYVGTGFYGLITWTGEVWKSIPNTYNVSALLVKGQQITIAQESGLYHGNVEQTWEKLTTPFPAEKITFLRHREEHLLVGTEQHGIWSLKPDLVTWRQLGIPRRMEGVIFQGEKTLIHVFDGNGTLGDAKLLLSQNQGNAWDIIYEGPIYSFHVLDETILVNTFQQVFTSIDQGATWEIVSGVINGFERWCLDSKNRFFAAQENRIYQYVPQQKNWKEVVHIPDEESITSFLITDDQNWIVVTLKGIYLSEDGGDTWKLTRAREPQLENQHIHYFNTAIAYDDQTVYVALPEEGVLRSQDGATSWNLYFASDPENDAMYVDHLFIDDQHNIWIIGGANNTVQIIKAEKGSQMFTLINNTYLNGQRIVDITQFPSGNMVFATETKLDFSIYKKRTHQEMTWLKL